MVTTLGCSKRSSLQHADLRVCRDYAEVQPRLLRRIELVSPDSNMGINNNDIGTIECALLERMYFCKVDGVFVAPPVPNGKVVRQRLKVFKEQVLSIMRKPSRLSPLQVVEMYSGRKRTIYGNALKSLDETPLCRRDSVSIAFVKNEMVDLSKAPRIIQPRNPRYNLMLGTYIKGIEHRIYRAIDRICGGPTVMKGYNVVEVGNIIRSTWESFAAPVAVGLDATKFDMHVSETMLGWEHSYYKRMYPRDQELNLLLDWQMNNLGSAYADDGHLKYSVRGRRFSGDMNTALGNVLLMCNMVHAYCDARKVNARFINNGDDVVVFMESRDLCRFQNGLKDWFFQLGFRMTVEEPVFELPKVEFCQMRPIRVGDDCVMVRNIPTAMIKDSKITNAITRERELQAWLTAVGECGLAIAGGVPVLQELYQCYLRNGAGVRTRVGESMNFQTGMRFMSRGVKLGYKQIEDKTRYDVYVAWDITPDEQRGLEEHYANLTIGYDGSVVDPEPLSMSL